MNEREERNSSVEPISVKHDYSGERLRSGQADCKYFVNDISSTEGGPSFMAYACSHCFSGILLTASSHEMTYMTGNWATTGSAFPRN